MTRCTMNNSCSLLAYLAHQPVLFRKLAQGAPIANVHSRPAHVRARKVVLIVIAPYKTKTFSGSEEAPQTAYQVTHLPESSAGISTLYFTGCRGFAGPDPPPLWIRIVNSCSSSGRIYHAGHCFAMPAGNWHPHARRRSG